LDYLGDVALSSDDKSRIYLSSPHMSDEGYEMEYVRGAFGKGLHEKKQCVLPNESELGSTHKKTPPNGDLERLGYSFEVGV